MLVKMKKTIPGSKDGITVQKFEAGKEYDLPERLASAFISIGVAEGIKSASAPDNKSAGPAPKNKSASKEEPEEGDDSDDEENAEEEAKRILAEQNARKVRGNVADILAKGKGKNEDKGKE